MRASVVDRPRALQRLLSTSLLLTGFALFACSSGSAPPPKQVTLIQPAAVAGDTAPAAPLSPSRWLTSGGSTLIGPELAHGHLLLLGGRRALLAKDGTLKTETVRCPEALLSLLEVPDEQGHKKLFGHGARTIFRFDDPLGAAVVVARSDVNIDHIGAGPASLAVWDFQSYLPRFIDGQTGKIKNPANLPALPMRAIAFRNAKEGAAIFEAAGLAVTADGGATWKVTADGSPGRDALRATGLRAEGDAVRAFVYSNGPSARVDIAGATLSAMEEPRELESEPALLRWIRVTERDPLEAAAAMGVESPRGGALIASHGLLARVDVNTGAILEMQAFSTGYGLAPCTLTKALGTAWLGCVIAEQEQGFDFVDPFAVFRVPSTGLVLEKPSLRRSGEAGLRASPSGGLLLTSPCQSDEEGEVCVRKPDGAFGTMRIRAEAGRSGAGPLADGSVAFLRGLEEGDDPGAADEDAPRENMGMEEESEGHRIQIKPTIYVMDGTGKEKRRAVLQWNEKLETQLYVQSPIEEDEEHTLRFALSDEAGGVFSVVQPAGRAGAVPQRIVGASYARLHGMRGLAVGEGRVLSTVDGAATWSDVELPERVRRSLGDGGMAYFDEPGTFMASEVGAKVDLYLRIGWGPSKELPESPPSDSKEILPARPTPPVTGGNVIQCTSTTTAVPSTPPLNGAHELMELFPKPKPAAASKASPTPGNYSWAPMGRLGMLDTGAVLIENADKPKEPPKTWTLRWYNAYELGAKPQSWTGPAPKEAAQGTLLRLSAGMGKRALFAMRSGGKNLLFRVKGTGSVESVEADNNQMPSGEVVFANDSSEIIAWTHDNFVIVWLPGEKPRAVANVGGRSQRHLGMPSKDGIPILLSFNDIALLGMLSVPALPKPEKGKTAAPAAANAPPPPPLSLDGWTQVPNVVRRDATKLPVCGSKSKGAHFVFASRLVALRTDGAPAPSPEAVYDVLVSPNDSCVLGVSAIMAAPRRIPSFGPGASGPAPSNGKKADLGPLTFVRADFANKKAEGGTRGAKGSARKMTCTF